MQTRAQESNQYTENAALKNLKAEEEKLKWSILCPGSPLMLK